MADSPNIGLHLTDATEETETFKNWRVKMNGTESSSNMMIIDAEFKKMQDEKDEFESTPFTWGMLKNGISG